MRRGLIRGLLVFGVIAGFGSGFAQLHHCRERHEQYQQQLMHQFAQNCVDAARTAPSAPAAAPGVAVAPGSTITLVVNPPAR